MKIITSLLLFSIFSINAQSNSNDTLKVVIATKFGELTFRKFCKTEKLEFVQSAKQIVDPVVEQEARDKNITVQKLKLKLTIDSYGKLKSCELVKSSRLNSLNVFLLEVFKDAILQLQTIEYSLSCDGVARTYIVPVVYKSQEYK